MAYRETLGWDINKLNDPTHNTPKYQFMRAAQDYGKSPEELDNNLQGFSEYLKKTLGIEAPVVSHDVLNWPGLGNVDILVDSGKGGFGFNPESDNAPAPGIPKAPYQPKPVTPPGGNPEIPIASSGPQQSPDVMQALALLAKLLGGSRNEPSISELLGKL